MTVWLVGVADVESNLIIGLYATKKLAEKSLFSERDRLIKEWQGQIDPRMIKGLSHDDYKSWTNYPHSVPYLVEMKVNR